MPAAFAFSATTSAICMAAYGDASSRFCLTTVPPEDLASVSAPVWSVMVMIVLLNDACTWAIPQMSSGASSAMLLLLRSLRVEFVRQRALAVELDSVLVGDGHLRGRFGHAPTVHPDVTVADELPR